MAFSEPPGKGGFIIDTAAAIRVSLFFSPSMASATPQLRR
jgi:hypothetical protein